MTAASIKVTVTQKPKATRLNVLIKSISGKLSDFRKVHKQASIFLDRWVQKNIKSEGGNLKGEDWPAFKIGGRWIKGRGLDTSAELLQDTGKLRLSYLPFHNNKNAGVGSALPYSKHHEHGEGVPVRRVLPVESEIRNSILAMFNAHAKRVSNVKR